MDWHSQSIWHKGLPKKWEKAAYSFELKFHGVELYLTSELSHQDMELQVGWVVWLQSLGGGSMYPKKSLGKTFS